MHILDDEDNYSNIITWMPDGKAFTIVNHKKFTKVEMPKIFNIKNMSSFVRKLARFGFTRIHDKQTMNSDIFAHKDFQRGCYERATQIKYGPPPPRSSSAIQPAMVPSPSGPAAASALAPAAPVGPTATVVEGSLPASPGLQISSSSSSIRKTLPHRVSIGDTLEGINYYLSSGSSESTSNSSSESTSNNNTNDRTLRMIAIESLLRQREALQNDADANALALVRLLQGQEWVRSTVESDPLVSQRSVSTQQHSNYHHLLLLQRLSHEQLLHLARQNHQEGFHRQQNHYTK
jgi:hypothetical protein